MSDPNSRNNSVLNQVGSNASKKDKDVDLEGMDSDEMTEEQLKERKR